jgi:hypothetical protein
MGADGNLFALEVGEISDDGDGITKARDGGAKVILHSIHILAKHQLPPLKAVWFLHGLFLLGLTQFFLVLFPNLFCNLPGFR